MKVKTIDTIGVVLVIIEIVWRVMMEQMERIPTWMFAVTWTLLALILVCIILHFVLRHQEKKREREQGGR